MCLEQEQQEHKLRSKNTNPKIKKIKKKKKKKKRIPLLEFESAKLQKYNLKTRNEIQI